VVEKNLELADYDQLLIVLADEGRLLIVVARSVRVAAIRITFKKGGPV
jgi:hypothetical protein